jgi:hypothetical protein
LSGRVLRDLSRGSIFLPIPSDSNDECCGAVAAL